MRPLASQTFPARMEALASSMAFVNAQCEAMGLDRRRAGEVELCLEEVLVNIIHYAYPDDAPGKMTVACSRDGDALVIEVSDGGTPFDILSAPEPDLTADVDQRRIGGLGIFFVKQLMDDVRYRRENDRNILTLVVNAPSEGPSPP